MSRFKLVKRENVIPKKDNLVRKFYPFSFMSLAKPSDIYYYITAYHAQKCCWHLTFFVRNYPTVQALAANLAIAAAYISAEAPIRSRVIMFENDIGRVISSFGMVWVKRTELSLLLIKKKTSKKFFLHSMLVSYSNWKLLLMVTPLTGCLNAPYVEGKCSCKTTKLSF